MKFKERSSRLAENWDDAYRADYKGRDNSILIINTFLEYGLSEEDAKDVYYSKHLRWMFDGNGDNKLTKDYIIKYLNANIKHIENMIVNEMGRKLVIA
jgi:hypothetical protein